MQTTVTFTEEEQYLAAIATRLPDLMSGLCDFQQSLRSELKYNEHVSTETLQSLYDTFYDLLGDYLL